MKVFLGTDHAGFELKEKIKSYLMEQGFEVVDCGAVEFDKDDDYPDLIAKAAQGVSSDASAMGIVMGGSGQGEAIVSNKFPGVRCALFYGSVVPAQAIDVSGSQSEDAFEMLKLTREHNNSNMLSLGVRFLSEEEAIKAVDLFLNSSYSAEERHARRIEKISKIEESLRTRT